MARIPESDIERIKRETDLAALVRSRGIGLKKHGNGHLIGPCPFHDDNEPSFIVTRAKGLYHCMGCGAAGNAIQFVEKFDGVSFRHAFELLNDGPAALTPPTNGRTKQNTVPRLDVPFDPEGSDADLFASVIDYYHERLLKTPAALDYLKSRGLHDEDMIYRFKLGFADRTLGLRLPEKNRKAGQAIRSRLQKLGLLRASGHEHFNGSLVVPVFDEGGDVAEIYGRKINNNQSKGYPLHLYLPGPHAGIWNLPALGGSPEATGELILCEAPLDALTFWMHGIQNVSFIYGTEGFPDYFMDALIQHKVHTVRLAYDNDPAGNRAAERDAERLAAQGIHVYRIQFPHGMDANEYAQKVQPANKSLSTAVKSAEWVGGPQDRARAPSSLVAVAAKKEIAAGPEPVERAASPSAISAPPRESPTLEQLGEYHIIELGPRHYRIGGLIKNNSLEVMKITLRLRYEESFHLDSLDLLRDGDRRRFIERAAEETRLEKALIKHDLGQVLLALERAQEERMGDALKSQQPEVSLDPEEEAEALDVLKSPDLISRIESAFESCGLVGEPINRLAAYLACTSRKLARPLAVIIQSTSAAGKSALMEAVLSFFPSEDQVKYSAMTGQSLYYLGESNLKHRILAIAEEEGAEKASYALKLLQSEGELTIASTGKDPHTGRMETQEYHVEGPVMIFLTTTAIDIDEELLNRCLVLTVDESKEQTQRIHQLQRQARTLEGLRLKKKKQRSLQLLQNVQRLLLPVDVVNPYADQLTFTAARTRTRRDHEKYLTLIDAIALLHQHQRPRETVEGSEFIRVTLEDIELANRLAPELLGRSLDELPPQSRRLLDHIKKWVGELCKREEVEQSLALFSRRQLCEVSGWTYSQVKRHLARLQEEEYIIARYGRMGTTLKYELLIDAAQAENEHPVGLLDVAKLKRTTTTRTPETATLNPPGQNGMAKLNASQNGTKTNLATLPDRTSGTLVETAS